LGANVGVEADGKHDNFERPVLVLRKFNRDAVLVVPLTSRPKQNPYHAMFHHEGETFSAVVSQIRLASTKRLLREFRCFKKFALIELFDLITYVDAQVRS
jgi:mRNA interferase MazF